MNDLCKKILEQTLNTITLKLRFFDIALNKLDFYTGGQSITTDGKSIFLNPEFVLKSYKENENKFTRELLHTVLHCVFRSFKTCGDAKTWELASDILVENILLEFDTLKLSCDNDKKALIEKLEIKSNLVNKIYKKLDDLNDEDFSVLSKAFHTDDHEIWYMTSTEKIDKFGKTKENRLDINTDAFGDEDIEKEWKSVSEKMQMEIEDSKFSNSSSNFTQNLEKLNEEKYDYSVFLRKFAVLDEKMQTNDDEFDYIFYNYGLELLGNAPLIEPLEYKDDKLVKEFVIAIDTSGSTTGQMVQAFLQKTYNILMQQENFSRNFNLHIIQCDCKIKEDFKITSKAEFDDYIRKCKIKGGGGTSFIPVFEHINKLVDNGEFTNLGGLIYFTDGYGELPAKKPSYNTAFAFLEHDSRVNIPAWAYRIDLDNSDLEV